ncbi:hypothetical protein I350_07510 [Cryptococcus amylolentus CBS 6273]|uniref:Uncharacterized protein n=1 Tax=Cryptococcus amylolentus CBS 6273 TaxID=1296118 RepID=A0A1E3JB32_9TREE|nr:hypothetical protein I350_07510 [Cryptococcus amylolentus CBS 6273]
MQRDRINLPTAALVKEAQEAKTVRLSKEQRNGMDAMFIVLRSIMCIWCIENNVTYTRARSEFCNDIVVRADTAWNLYQQTAEAKKTLAKTAVERREHGSVVAHSKTKTPNVKSNSAGKSSVREDLDSDEEEEEDEDTRSDERQEGTEDGDEQDDDEQDVQRSNQGQLDRLGREGEGNDGEDDQPHFIRRAYKARQVDWREENGAYPRWG